VGGQHPPAGREIWQKDALLATARAEGADEAVLRTLAQLPDMRYSSPIEVSRAIGRLA
jgi:hypothetical protein